MKHSFISLAITLALFLCLSQFAPARIEKRIAKTQKQIDTKLPPASQYIVTSSEFDEVRTRVAVLENRHRITEQNKDDKPTLRRAPKATDDSNTEDDQPTLKRRENYS